ncbi:MAG: alpha/beta hydrolase, partial [Bacteroidota bacterium]
MVSPVIDPKSEKFYWFSGIGKWSFTQLFLPHLLNVATKEKYAHVAEMKKMEKQWQRLYVPTTVVMGENDHIADTANFDFAQKKINTAPVQFYKLKNTGHLITYERPEFISDLLIKSVK